MTKWVKPGMGWDRDYVLAIARRVLRDAALDVDTADALRRAIAATQPYRFNASARQPTALSIRSMDGWKADRTDARRLCAALTEWAHGATAESALRW